MSIFLSIPTLEDPEIIHTVHSAIENCEGDVCVGVACMTSKKFFNELVLTFKNFSNVRIKWFDPEENVGVGRGRNNARSMYDEEKYFIQVDSHTAFLPSWDSKLIDLYNISLEETKNQKTVLTAYIGMYSFNENKRFLLTDKGRYPVFSDSYFSDRIPIKRWFDIPVEDFPDRYKVFKKILPANKFNAQFAMGNKNFAENYGLPEHIIFFEEEIVQSINLLGNGFSLAFPNTALPILHLYQDYQNENKRQSLGEMKNLSPHFELEIARNFIDFIYDEKNEKKCKKFEKHSGYGIYQKPSFPFFVPEKYSFFID